MGDFSTITQTTIPLGKQMFTTRIIYRLLMVFSHISRILNAKLGVEQKFRGWHLLLKCSAFELIRENETLCFWHQNQPLTNCVHR